MINEKKNIFHKQFSNFKIKKTLTEKIVILNAINILYYMYAVLYFGQILF